MTIFRASMIPPARERATAVPGHCYAFRNLSIMQLAAGDRIAQYEILGPLGAGGMGEVYRARDCKLVREVALKILPAELSRNDDALRRFEQEARAASALNHPNIVTIYEIGQTDDMAWIAMELVDGSDLRALAAREPLSLKVALRIAAKMCEGLAAAHDRGIVHRDLKPENVMVTSDGFVKILDFGLAKQARMISADDSTLPHTTPGTVFGTVGYMSPEQAKGEEMDHRSDQFSFGVMLYEMLTRTRPFEAPTKAEMVAAIMRDTPKPPSDLNEAVPPDLDRLVSRCLAKQPRDRYASTRDLARDLREIRDSLTGESARLRSGSGRHDMRPAPPRLTQLFVVLGALAVFTAGYVMWQRRSAPAASPQRITSLAVAPFRDLSESADGRLLSDGISELVGAHLADVRELRVAMLDREDEDLGAIRNRTGAQAVVRGAVQREGEDVLVTWSMVDATGATLRSDSIRGSLRDLFALENSVADSLLQAVAAPRPVSVRPQTSRLGAEAQKAFVEAFGVVRRSRDEKSLDTAVASLQLLLRDYGDSPAVNALLARALLNKASLSGRIAWLEQATVYANRAIALDPSDPDALVTLGLLQGASGRGAEAIRSFEHALRIRPDLAEAMTGMGDALQQLGRGADAEAAYQKSIDLRPDGAGTFMKYGAFCLARGRNDDAIRLFTRAAQLLPDSSRAFVNLGSAHHAGGRYEEALAAYAKAIEIEPTAAAFSNTGTIHFYRGQYAQACRAYERATELAPWDYLMWANLGDAYRWTPQMRERSLEAYERSIEKAGEVLRVNPADVVARGVVAVSKAKSGDGAGASKEMQLALERDPTNPIVLYQAAVVAHLAGRRDSALSWLERAIASGYPRPDVAADPEFASLRADPAYKLIVETKNAQVAKK
jgi:serine/threonine protein kinase/tetratricopeptide (TPR) repeat protein